jgi:hypothetical protein
LELSFSQVPGFTEISEREREKHAESDRDRDRDREALRERERVAAAARDLVYELLVVCITGQRKKGAAELGLVVRQERTQHRRRVQNRARKKKFKYGRKQAW